MPGNIHNRYRNTSADEAGALRSELNELRRDVAQLVRVISEQTARPNPAPSGGLSDQVLVQLLLSERERADRANERLIQASDPIQQINSLVALADVLPAKESDDSNEMMKSALMALGSVIANKMDSGDEGEADPGDYQPDETHGQEQYQQPPEQLFVAADPGERPASDAAGGLDMGT
jgi:hypothetical protein